MRCGKPPLRPSQNRRERWPCRAPACTTDGRVGNQSRRSCRKNFCFNRRSTVRAGIPASLIAADYRDPSGQRQRSKELAAPKLGRVVFKGWWFANHREGTRAPGKASLFDRDFGRGGQSTDRTTGKRMETSTCLFRKKFAAASVGRSA